MKRLFIPLVVSAIFSFVPACLSAQTDTTLFESACRSFGDGKTEEARKSFVEFLAAEAADPDVKRPDLRLDSYLILAKISQKEKDFETADKWLHCAHLFALKDESLKEEYFPLIRSGFETNKSLKRDYERTRKELYALLLLLAVLFLSGAALFIGQHLKLRKAYSKMAERTKAWARDVPPIAIGGGTDTESPLLVKIRTLFETEKIYLSRELSLDSLSEALHTNRTYVSSAIRAVSPNFNRFVSDYRIKEAVRLLDEGWNETIEELALRCGYSNAKTFSNAFKDVTGLTPGSFRRNS